MGVYALAVPVCVLSVCALQRLYFGPDSRPPDSPFSSLLRLVRVTNKFISSICVDCLEKGKIPQPRAEPKLSKKKKSNSAQAQTQNNSSHFTVSAYPLDNCRQFEERLISTLFSPKGFSSAGLRLARQVDLVLLAG